MGMIEPHRLIIVAVKLPIYHSLAAQDVKQVTIGEALAVSLRRVVLVGDAADCQLTGRGVQKS